MKQSTDRKAEQEAKVSYPQIDALKGMAIFLVILGHAIIYYPVDLHENPACAALFNWLSAVHMPLFLLSLWIVYLYF